MLSHFTLCGLPCQTYTRYRNNLYLWALCAFCNCNMQYAYIKYEIWKMSVNLLDWTGHCSNLFANVEQRQKFSLPSPLSLSFQAAPTPSLSPARKDSSSPNLISHIFSLLLSIHPAIFFLALLRIFFNAFVF